MQAANDMTQHTPKRVFFPFGGGCEGGMLYPCVPMLFSMTFSKFPMCFPGVFAIVSHRISYPLPKVLLFTAIYLSQRETLHPHIKPIILGSLLSFSFFG